MAPDKLVLGSHIPLLLTILNCFSYIASRNIYWQGFGNEIPEWNHSIHASTLMYPFNSCTITQLPGHIPTQFLTTQIQFL